MRNVIVFLIVFLVVGCAMQMETPTGRTIIVHAKEKAVENGILEENILTEERTGDIASQIKNSANEHNADLVVIGHPESDAGFLERHLISKEGTESFVKRLKEKIGSEVMIV